MSKNARINVEVNTDNAQNKLRELANETSRVNNQINSDSSSHSASDVNGSIDTLRKRSDNKAKEIRREYENLRKANLSEFDDFSQRHSRGEISDDEFSEYRQGWNENQTSSFADERDELAKNQERTNQLIQELIDQQDASVKEQIISQQRDNSEHTGILRNLFEKRSSLMSGRMDATTEDELSSFNKQIAKVNKQIRRKSGGGNIITDKVTQGGNFASQMFSGGNAGQMAIGSLSKMGPYGAMAAAVLAAVGGGIILGNKRDKEISNLTSYRALGDRDDIDVSIRQRGFTRYGLESAEFINKRKELLMASGNFRAGGVSNTYDAIRLEKGYGIESVANLSSNERQDKYGKSTADNIMEMLNVLSQIRDGSISVEDLTLANEKSQLMFRLQSGQTSVQEKFDSKSILGLMTAFEKMGGEGKDQRAGSFIEGTLNAMREGGDKNMMLLKHKFAIDAHPELANDPAAINRLIEEGTDGNYISSTLRGLNTMAGSNKQNKYFLFKEFFKGLTPSMRQKLMDSSGDDEILANMAGHGLKSSNDFNQNNADKYAYSKTQGSEEVLGEIKAEISNVGSDIKEIFRSPIDVNIRNVDKSKAVYSSKNIVK